MVSVITTMVPALRMEPEHRTGTELEAAAILMLTVMESVTTTTAPALRVEPEHRTEREETNIY
jgi:hypothetical protein